MGRNVDGELRPSVVDGNRVERRERGSVDGVSRYADDEEGVGSADKGIKVEGGVMEVGIVVDEREGYDVTLIGSIAPVALHF